MCVPFKNIPVPDSFCLLFGVTSTQSSLEDNVASLKKILSDKDSQHIPESGQILIVSILHEVETWMKDPDGAVMEYDAQLALSSFISDSGADGQVDDKWADETDVRRLYVPLKRLFTILASNSE
jgi:hypothetical protein